MYLSIASFRVPVSALNGLSQSIVDLSDNANAFEARRLRNSNFELKVKHLNELCNVYRLTEVAKDFGLYSIFLFIFNFTKLVTVVMRIER